MPGFLSGMLEVLGVSPPSLSQYRTHSAARVGPGQQETILCCRFEIGLVDSNTILICRRPVSCLAGWAPLFLTRRVSVDLGPAQAWLCPAVILTSPPATLQSSTFLPSDNTAGYPTYPEIPGGTTPWTSPRTPWSRSSSVVGCGQTQASGRPV